MSTITIATYPVGLGQYRIPFDYLQRTFVEVSLLSSTAPETNRVLTVGSDYSFLNATVIELLAPQTGFDSVQLRRFTATDLVVSFRDGSVLTAKDLTNAELQAIHIAEEGRDQTVGLASKFAEEAGQYAKEAQDLLDEINSIGLNGYTPIGSFELGVTVDNGSQVVSLGSGDTISYWRWEGSKPYVVPASSTPESSGGVGRGKWVDTTDATLRGQLAQPNGSSLVMHGNETVGSAIESLKSSSQILPIKFTTKYNVPMVTDANPQGLAEDATYWYLTTDVTGSGTPYVSRVSRINKETGVTEVHPIASGSHGQGIGVLKDGRIFIGGRANSKLTIYNFQTGTVVEHDCVGIYKDFPFCFDADSNTIYQLQDANATSGNLVRIAALDFNKGFQSDFTLPTEVQATGYSQGIATDGSSLYIGTGGSWATTVGGSWNDKWNLFRLSIGGVVLDRRTYRRNSMSKLTGLAETTVHEPQGIFYRNGRLSFMQYIGISTDVRVVIFEADKAGEVVRAIPSTQWTTYSDLDMVGVKVTDLKVGSSIVTISKAMKDRSTITFSLSGEPYFAADLGVSFGLCTIHRVNENRVYAVAVASDSSVGTYDYRPSTGTVSVWGGKQTAPVLTRGRLAKAVLEYEGGSVANAGSISVSRIKTCDALTILMTHTAGTYPRTPHRFTRAELDYYIEKATPLYIGDGSGFMSFSFTNAGIAVKGQTGNAIVAGVLAQ